MSDFRVSDPDIRVHNLHKASLLIILPCPYFKVSDPDIRVHTSKLILCTNHPYLLTLWFQGVCSGYQGIYIAIQVSDELCTNSSSLLYYLCLISGVGSWFQGTYLAQILLPFYNPHFIALISGCMILVSVYILRHLGGSFKGFWSWFQVTYFKI